MKGKWNPIHMPSQVPSHSFLPSPMWGISKSRWDQGLPSTMKVDHKSQYLLFPAPNNEDTN